MNICSHRDCNREVSDSDGLAGICTNIDGLDHPLCPDHFEEFARWENGFFGGMMDEALEDWLGKLRKLRRLDKTDTGRLERLLFMALDEPIFRLENNGDRVSGSVISDSFVGMEDSDRQTMMWKIIRGGLDRHKLGTLLAYTNDEWNIPLGGDLD